MLKSFLARAAVAGVIIPTLLVASNAHAMTSSHLLGRILLQVEDAGQAYYVNPLDGLRTYLPNGNIAYNLMRQRGLGISNADLSQIPIGIFPTRILDLIDSDSDGLSDVFEEAIGSDVYNADTDGDGYDDATELHAGYSVLGLGRPVTNVELTKRLMGRILLQVEDRGQAWYLNPVDGKRYFMPNGEVAYQLMRQFGLGISNEDLMMIEVQTLTQVCGDDLACALDGLDYNLDTTSFDTYGSYENPLGYTETRYLNVAMKAKSPEDPYRIVEFHTYDKSIEYGPLAIEALRAQGLNDEQIEAERLGFEGEQRQKDVGDITTCRFSDEVIRERLMRGHGQMLTQEDMGVVNGCSTVNLLHQL